MKTDTTPSHENQILEEPYLCDLPRLSVLAAAFLAASAGDAEKAINVLDETRHAPDIGVETAGAALDSGICIGKIIAEGNRTAQLHAAVSANRTWGWGW